MKKVLFVITIATLWFGCKKSGSSNNNTSIIGKWYIQSDYTKVYLNGTATQDTTVYLPNHSAYLLFNSNGSGAEVAVDGDATNYTYRVSDKTLTFTFPKETIAPQDTAPPYSESVTISILTSSKLELQGTQTDTISAGIQTIFQKQELER
jgi:hypothetical protein